MVEFVLGIDGGTECVKSGIYNLKGNTIGIGSSYYKTYHLHPGWADQKIEEWDECLIKSIKEAIKVSGIDPQDIIGVGHDGTCCTVVFMDEDNQPVRDAIIWMDVRASEEARFIESIDDPARKYNGYSNISPEWFPCKNLWVKKNQPEIYKKAKTIANYTDWMTFRLTGKWTMGISETTIRAYYDNRNGGWQKDFYKKIGIEDLFEKLPPEVFRLGEHIGGITKEISQKTGITQGTPVAQGAVDATAASIGANGFGSGKVFMGAGSSTWIQINVDREFHAKGLFGSYPDVVEDNFTLEGGQVSTGSVLKWFKSQFISKEIEEEAKKRDLSIYDYMNTLAEKLPLGSEGLIIVEHWQGNRTPFTDPNSRGIIRGLSLKHTPAHVYRAIMEAVAYGTEASLRIVKENNMDISEVIAVGGHTKSKLWMQIYSDVTGLSIRKTTNPEATSLGAAILAAVATGKYKDVTEAANNMVQLDEEVKPNMENHKEYKFFVEQYIKTYKALKDDIRETNEHIKDL